MSVYRTPGKCTSHCRDPLARTAVHAGSPAHDAAGATGWRAALAADAGSSIHPGTRMHIVVADLHDRRPPRRIQISARLATLAAAAASASASASASAREA